MPAYVVDVLVDPENRSALGAQRAERNIRRISDAASVVAGRLEQVRRLIIGIGSVYVFRRAIGDAFRFRDAMVEVSTLVDTATFNLAALERQARQNAITFGSSPTIQARAYYQVISAGALDAADAIEVVDTANRLAVGGFSDVFTTADALTTALNAYGREALTARDASDALFTAMRLGKTTVDELSRSLGRAVPFTAQAGISFDELAATIAALTRVGISTKEAVTGIRALVSAILKPTGEATIEVERLRGVILALGEELDNPELSATRLQELGLSSRQIETFGIERLRRFIAEANQLSDFQFNPDRLRETGLHQFLLDLVRFVPEGRLPELFGGIEALAPTLALVGPAADDFIRILEEMRDNANETDIAFRKVAENSPGFAFRAAVSALKDIVLGAALALERFLIPALQAIAFHTDDVIRSIVLFGIVLSSTFAFRGIRGIGDAAVAFLGLRGAIAGVMRFLYSLAAAWLVALGPIGLILVAINAAIAATLIFSDRIKVTSDGAVSLQDVLLTAWSDISGGIVNAARTIDREVGIVLQDMGINFESLSELVTTALGRIFTGLKIFTNFMIGLTRIIVRSLGTIITTVINVTVGVLRGVQQTLTTIKDFVLGIIDDLTAAVRRAADFLGIVGELTGITRQPQDSGPRGSAFDPLEEVNKGQGRFNEAGATAAEQFAEGFRNAYRNSGLAESVAELTEELTTDYVGDPIARAIFRARLANFDSNNPLTRGYQQRSGGGRPTADGTPLGEFGDEFERNYQNLTTENFILEQNVRLRNARADLLQFENNLTRSVTDAERDVVIAALDRNALLMEQTRLLQEQQDPLREITTRTQALNALHEEGAISAREYANGIRQAQLDLIELNANSETGTFADGFITGLRNMLEATRNFSVEFGQIMGNAVSSFIDNFSNAIGRAIFTTEDFGEVLKAVGRTIVTELVSSLIKLGIQFVINATLGKAIAATATAASAAQATALAAAWATPAALASLATLGANAAPATAALASTTAFSTALAAVSAAVPGFQDGTDFVRGPGTGRSDSIAARLSFGEGVVTASANRANPGIVARMNRGERISEGYGGRPQVTVVIENNAPGVEHTVEQDNDGRIRIIAEEVARGVVNERAGSVVAAELRDANSPVSRSLGRNTDVGRRRT